VTPGARLAAAVEVLNEMFARRAAADRALAAWGKAHRFAGSKDRAAIAERVYAVLRRRNECAFRMQDERARALVIGSLAVADGLGLDAINALCTDGAHALGGLTSSEVAHLADARAPGEPWIRGNYPEWLHGALLEQFGDRLSEEMAALNARAPLDLRVNALKATREAVLAELTQASIAATALAAVPFGVRIAAGADAKVTKLDCYLQGRVEIQDEASQRAVLLADAKPGGVVVDLAAGGGGKSLALAAAMKNEGRVLACDIDPARLQPLVPRAERAGATIIARAGDPYGAALVQTVGDGADIVFIDAPCSGSGTWRRNPEAKWTLDAVRLRGYCDAQVRLLDRGVEFTRPGGRMIYAVCSVLPCERREQIDAFLRRRPGWRVDGVVDLTPARDQTDGFFAARLAAP
jgi:16S rRNA (cytosine967-C5)-methyltransferase